VEAAEQHRQDEEQHEQGDHPEQASGHPRAPRPAAAGVPESPAKGPGHFLLQPALAFGQRQYDLVYARLKANESLDAGRVIAGSHYRARYAAGHAEPIGGGINVLRLPYGKVASRAAGLAAAVAAVLALLLVLSAVHLLPQLRNPFAETTTVRNQPVLLKSITALSRYEAASGSFQVVVELSRQTGFLPSFIAGSQTLFIGEGTVIAFVDFSQLKNSAIKVSQQRTAVTIKLPPAQLEPAVLNVTQSYVFAEQQGLLNRVANFFSGNPNSQQQVYILAQQKIESAAHRSALVAQAEKNTQGMLGSMLNSLGYRHVTVTFGTT
jgi:hypothetical protein